METDAMLELTGTPRTIGNIWGKINAPHINGDMEKYFLTPARKAGISRKELLNRNAEFIRLSQKLAPHWLEEGSATARAANINEDIYLSFCGSVYRGLFLGDECTSYSISPEAADGNRIFFHKTRDNAEKGQCAFILKSSKKGINKFIAVSDASVIACMMMVNDKGLAGSADTGGQLAVKKPQFRGMMNTHILRYIAEKACSCEDALNIVKEFVSERWYAGGAKTGTHWHFVDSQGKRLEISCNSEESVHKYHTEKVYFSAREKAKCAKTLWKAKPPIDFAAFRNVSRDSSMCFPSSIAGMSVEISRKYPDILSCAWVSLPAKGLGFPLFIGGTKTPLPLIDGKIDSILKKLPGNPKRWEKIEKFNFMNQGLVNNKIEDFIAARKTKKISGLLNEWTEQCANSNLAAINQI